ncbi:MAG TPA: energy transducer TonB [Holophagaceae bacterium]|jgi:TonB family protein|nr:energy transducer TonB [Holophagaceae bacterium]
MKSRLLIPTLLALPLCAQAPAETHPVRFILQADPPPAGVPALDTTAIANALQAFAAAQHLERPAPDGDGWVLGVRLTTRQRPGGPLIAMATMRLSRLKSGQVEQEGAKEDVAAAEAHEAPQLASALGRDLVRRAQRLLSQVHVVPPTAGHKVPVVATEPDGPILEMDKNFPQSSGAYIPPQPPYPQDAKGNRVQGTVILEVTVNTLGVTESVTAIEGPGPLLTYAMEWAMHWRYKPLEANGKPIRVRFPLHVNFRLQ